MPLNSQLQTALEQPAVLMVCAVRLALPGATVRLTDGPTPGLTIEGETYTGLDATFGALASVEPVTEQIGTEAPRVQIGLLPPSNAALAALTAPAAQGSEVRVYLGAVNAATGQLIGTAELLFVGELDTAESSVGRGARVLQVDCGSAWERLFAANEGAGLNDPFHQRMWPGERAFEYVPLVQRQLPWGQDAPRPGVVTDRVTTPFVGAGGGGGGDIQMDVVRD